MMPAAMECGVLSVMMLFFSNLSEMNLDNMINSWLMLSLLQYRSMNELGVVDPKSMGGWVPPASEFRSMFFMKLTAIEHPFVALGLSSLNISAISWEVRGQPLSRHEM
jgi:hypothetical protein